MNWGYRIITVYIIFVAGIIYLVARSSSQNQDLVTSDYYEQELKYQGRIDDIERTNALTSPVKYELKERELFVYFPPEMKNKKITGRVLLYCVADKGKDIQKDFTTADGQVHFSIPAANNGWFDLKISWNENSKNYYYEHKLQVQ